MNPRASRATVTAACLIVVAVIGIVLVCALRAHAATITCYGRLYVDGTNGGSGTQIINTLPCYGSDNQTTTPPGCHFIFTPVCKRLTYNPDGLWYGHCDNSIHGDPTDEYCNDDYVASTLTTSHATTYSCTDGTTACAATCADFVTDPPQNVNADEPTLDYFNAQTGDICSDS